VPPEADAALNRARFWLDKASDALHADDEAAWRDAMSALWLEAGAARKRRLR
jgi:hypothetical protein